MKAPFVATTLALTMAALLVATPLAATAGPAAADPPAISIVAPGDGAQVSGSSVLIWVRVENFTLDGTKIGTAPAEGVGHWHLNVDGKYAGLSVSNVISLPNPAFPTVEAGPHEISVDLHNNDHTPVAGAEPAKVTVTFANKLELAQPSGTPGARILAPADQAQLTGSGPFVVRAAISGLQLDGTKIGTAPAEGVGHWHLNVDGKYAGLSVSDAITLPNPAYPTLSAGTHELAVDLHNNDHTPVAGAAPARITIYVDRPLSLEHLFTTE